MVVLVTRCTEMIMILVECNYYGNWNMVNDGGDDDDDDDDNGSDNDKRYL